MNFSEKQGNVRETCFNTTSDKKSIIESPFSESENHNWKVLQNTPKLILICVGCRGFKTQVTWQ